MTRDDLLAALKAATEPSRELDAEIAVSVLGGEIVWKQANYTMELYPARKYLSSAHIKGYGLEPILEYTSSIDAAMTLVPEGWNYEMHGEIFGKPLVFLRTTAKHPKFCKKDDPGTIQIHTATLALALCIAALLAAAAEKETQP
jgi:hypothetical protein